MTSTPRIGSERNAALRTVARLNKPPQGHRTSNIPPRNDRLLSLPDVGSNPERSTTRFAGNAPATSNDSGVSSNLSSSLEQVLAELQESNKHFKDLKSRMDGLDSRMKAIEECNDADDESESSSRKTAKKRKRKSAVPKDIRVRSPQY